MALIASPGSRLRAGWLAALLLSPVLAVAEAGSASVPVTLLPAVVSDTLDAVLPEGVAPEPVIEVPAACRGGEIQDPRWFDRAQDYWSQRACVPAVWFDRFFGETREDDEASALLRVIPSLQYSDRDFTDVGIRFSGRMNLPRLEERLSLVINEEEGADRGLLPGEVERPEQANAPGRESSAALRYLHPLADQSTIHLDVGLRSEMKFFARARYVHYWRHHAARRTRFTQSVFFRDGEGFGETSLVEVERMLAEDMLLRWSTQATVSEEANGLEWREGLQLYRQIDRDRALSWNIGMSVKSDPAWKAQDYSTSIRYRQRAFRPWFYFEIEPFLDWVRVDNFNTNPGIAFRVEFWLGHRGPSATEPPPASLPAAAVVPEVVPEVTASPTTGDPTAAP